MERIISLLEVKIKPLLSKSQKDNRNLTYG